MKDFHRKNSILFCRNPTVPGPSRKNSRHPQKRRCLLRSCLLRLSDHVFSDLFRLSQQLLRTPQQSGCDGHPSDEVLLEADGEIRLRDGKAVGINEREILLKAEEEALETAKRAKHLHPFAWPEKEHWGQTKIYFDEVRFDLDENRKDGGHY